MRLPPRIAVALGLLAAQPVLGAEPAGKFPPTAADILAAAPATAWRPIPAENLLRMELADGRAVIIELTPVFAPQHVANIRSLVRQKWFDGNAIVRVRDNYVAQWGGARDDRAVPADVPTQIPAEYERPLKGVPFTPLPFPDSYAPRTGFSDTWPVGADANNIWLTHCYGAVAVGRSNAPDTGSGIELYAIIGHAQRHMDRNLAVVGRVVEGMDVLSALPRGPAPQGNYEKANFIPIAKTQGFSASDAAAPRFEVLRTDTPTFTQYVNARANRLDAFYAKPAAGIDVCNVQVPIQRRK
ncbi:MAG: peptidylprolyl isomerase [Rhodospirillaceae bacterium]|nr:peptidylprolyl isomerase [Rhodospirillaceae bacterium]